MNTPPIETTQKVQAFIKQFPCGTIATQNATGGIDLANVFVHIDDDSTLYLISRPDNRKHANLETHPEVSLLFTDQMSLTQTEVSGVATIMTEAAAVTRVLPAIQTVLIDHTPKHRTPPVSQLTGDGYVVIKIVPERITYRSYSPYATKEDLEEITLDL